MAKAFAAGAFIALVPTVSLATDVAGSVAADTVWTASQSPYRVTADIVIENGAMLSIEPGVMVRMEAGTNITVNVGALRILGTAAQPVILTSFADDGSATPAPGDWGSLRFLDGTDDTRTVLEHTHVRYGQGIIVASASPTLNYLTLTDNSGPAIRADLNSSPVGTGLQASGNAINGILVPAGDVVGTVLWGLRGVPYLISEGIVSVGQSPVVTSITPNEIEQGTTVDVLINGARLSGVETLQASRAEVSTTVLPGGTAAFIPVRITAPAEAALGAFGLEVQLEAGRLALADALTVIAPRPTAPLSVLAAPNPLAVPPDGVARTFFLRLSAPQLVDRSFSLAVRNSAIATVSPAVVNFAPGQTFVALSLVGLQAGETTLEISSTALSVPAEFPIFVSTDFAKINFAHGPVVGIVKGDPTLPTAPSAGNPVASVHVGIVKGDPTLPPTSSSGNPVVSTVTGIVKGDPTLPVTTTSGSPSVSPVIGVVKGDPTLPLVPTSGNPIVSPVVGVQK